MRDGQTSSAIPTEAWACVADASDFYEMRFATRAEALEALRGRSGSLLRYRRGYPRAGLEFLFDIEQILSGLEERAGLEGRVIADFENGLFDAIPEQEEDLRRRLADTVFQWVKEFDPPCWEILEIEDVETQDDAKDDAP